MKTRKNIPSGLYWEEFVGYSRAVRVGNLVEVAGTTAIQDTEIIGKEDPYTQTKFILGKISDALKSAGASMEHVVRTRIYVTDIRYWEEVGRAHGEYFREIRPASTLVEINRLIHPDLLVEIEATAVCPDE